MRIQRKRKYLYLSVSFLLLISTLNATMYTTSTGMYVGIGCGDSMEPNYQSGDVILYDADSNIREGDVVRLDVEHKEPDIYHRVIEIDPTKDDPYYLKGDNNNFTDGWYSDTNIKGVSEGQIANANLLCRARGLK